MTVTLHHPTPPAQVWQLDAGAGRAGPGWPGLALTGPGRRPVGVFASAVRGRVGRSGDARHEPADQLRYFRRALDMDVVGDTRDHFQSDVVALGDAERGAGRRGTAVAAEQG